MGRRRKGPVQLNGGDTWYARLWVPEKDRKTVGKGTLIRSLKTTSHAEALKRYGGVYTALEQELKNLLKPKGLDGLRQAVEAVRGDDTFSAGELLEIVASDLLPSPASVPEDQNNPLLDQVYKALSTGQQIPLNWQEAIELWVTTRNREKARPLTGKTIRALQRSVESIQAFGQPTDISKDSVRSWIKQRELHKQPISVKADFKLLQGLFTVLLKADHVSLNPFQAVGYTVAESLDAGKREFTDEELKIIKVECPEVFMMCLTSLRPGEFASRLPADLDGDMLIIDEQPSLMISSNEHWRPKTLSSYRRVPVPSDYVSPDLKRTYKTRMVHSRGKIQSLFGDPLCTPHSGRHTFYSLSRRAGLDRQISENIAGHASSIGSKTAKNYGSFSDDVLKREAVKLWKFVQDIIEA